MICSIHQPQTFPWLGYFAKIIQSDVFIFLDNVQFKKNEFQNRNKIKTHDSWNWLTVPVIHNFGQNINKVKINNNIRWKHKHLQTLKSYYGKANYFHKYFPEIKQLYENNWIYLSDFNIAHIKWMMEKFQITTPTFIASQIDISKYNEQITPDTRLIILTKEVNADIYLSGIGGKKYLNIDLFPLNNIRLIFQEFSHPEYKQLNNNFLSCMSALDLLFNEGENSRNIINKGFL